MNHERRAESRISASALDRELRVRLRPGHHVQVVNISGGGVLIEGTRRLAPGASIELQFDTEHGRSAYRGRVVRSYVSAVGPEVIVYRTGLALDTEIAWLAAVAGEVLATG